MYRKTAAKLMQEAACNTSQENISQKTDGPKLNLGPFSHHRYKVIPMRP